jgi:hypothetical protein
MEKKEENYYHLIHNTTTQSNSINSINDQNNFNIKENPIRNFNAPNQNKITNLPFNSINGIFKN